MAIPANYASILAANNGYLTSDVLNELGLTQTTTPGGGTGYEDSSGTIYTFNGSSFQPVAAQTSTTPTPTGMVTTYTATGGATTSTPAGGATSPTGTQTSTGTVVNGQTYTSAPTTAPTPQNIKVTILGGGGGEIQFTYNGQQYTIGNPSGTDTNTAITNYLKQIGAYEDSSAGVLAPSDMPSASQFPSNPIEGQTTTIDGITYAYGPDGTWAPQTSSGGTGGGTGASTGTGGGTGASTGTGGGTGTTISGTGISYNSAWSQYGISQSIWDSMTPTQQAVVATALNAGTSLYSTTSSTVTLQQALAAAASDPNLIATYADAQKIDAQTLQQSIQAAQTATTTQSQSYQQQFEADRKQLANAQAAAGTAYSGFRTQAENNLAETESGIVTSSKAALQQQLNSLTTQFEAKYGSTATNPATANYVDPYASSTTTISGLSAPNTPSSQSTLTGQLAGGITGTQPIAKQNAINQEAAQYVTAGAIPNVVAA